jgi:signal transduction histidine kinase
MSNKEKSIEELAQELRDLMWDQASTMVAEIREPGGETSEEIAMRYFSKIAKMFSAEPTSDITALSEMKRMSGHLSPEALDDLPPLIREKLKIALYAAIVRESSRREGDSSPAKVPVS